MICFDTAEQLSNERDKVNFAKPFAFQMVVPNECDSGAKLQLPPTVQQWAKAYKKNNPKYNLAGRTFHALTSAQGKEEALAALQVVLQSCGMTVLEGTNVEEPHIYGYSPVLQHSGTDPSYKATVHFHMCGTIEYVIVNPMIIENGGLDLGQVGDNITEELASTAEQQCASGIVFYTARKNCVLYTPVGWITFMRVLSGDGDSNSIHGLRVAFYPKCTNGDPKAALSSMQALLDKGISASCPVDLKPRAANLVKAIGFYT